jgi:malate synthase
MAHGDHDIRVIGPIGPGYDAILTPAALGLVAELTRAFRPRVRELLAARERQQEAIDAGELPVFPPETAGIRAGDWTVAPLPADLLDRRVEITGPVDRKMIINALNSGASTFMADLEDSNAPTWANVVEGQINLRDAVAGDISYDDAARGKHYALAPDPAVLLVRPRGWHLWEKHVLVDGEPVPAGIFDFALYFFHNARPSLAKGSGPYFYLPKLQHYLEARLWNEVFVAAQESLGVPRGSIKATVLIETLPAAFQMDEILWELREHSAGLNCGRWDYIFSFIKTFRAHGDRVLPDRGEVGMTQPFMTAYTSRVIQVCHRRAVHAMGGMAAQIPIKDDPEAHAAAMAKVRQDKLREVTSGHDGTWVAHPGLVGLAREVFDAHMPTPNQIALGREDVDVSPADLLELPTGTITEAGLRQNVDVGVQYLASWLAGQGCVPIYNLMEDAATAEISRTQVWQWLRHGARLDDGRTVTKELVEAVLDQEQARQRELMGADRYDASTFPAARALFVSLSTSEAFVEFLTLPAYDILVAPTLTLQD